MTDSKLIALALVGAYLYTRQARARTVAPRTTTTAARPPGELPGSVGSGVQQAIGGALAGALTSALTRATAPGGYFDQFRNSGYLGNAAAQEIAWDQVTPDVIVPASISTTGLEQDWTVG